MITAEHRKPVKSAPHHNAPETVPDRRVRVHVEKLESVRFPTVLPNRGNPAGPSDAEREDAEERPQQHRRLESVGHYNSFHATL